jgi:hypothetical protein|nr:MAG TPA: hypothetical protein [Caudoviricetes sp.]
MKGEVYRISARESMSTAEAIEIACKYVYSYGVPAEDAETMKLFYAMCEYVLRVHYRLMRYINPKIKPEPKALAAVNSMVQDEVNRLLKGIAEKEECRVSVKEDKAELLTMEQWEAVVRAIRKELGEEEQDE